MNNTTAPRLLGRRSPRGLCTDDLIRDPQTGRLARVLYADQGALAWYVGVADLETADRGVVTLAAQARVNVWIG